jgi:uroporphyrinogen decarboxylase
MPRRSIGGPTLEETMDARERVLTTLAHREPDRVPFDLGGTIVTGIHEEAYRRLVPALGLPPRQVVVQDRTQHLAAVDDDVRDLLQVDTGGLFQGTPIVTRQREEVRDGYAWIWDDFGMGWRCPVDGGLYHDLAHSPLAGDISIDDVRAQPSPEPADEGRTAGMRERALHMRDEERRAVCIWGFGGGILETASWLRGLEQFFMDLAGDPDLACAIMDRVLEWKLAYYEHVLSKIGDVVDVFFEGDDAGTQQSLLISPEAYRRYVKPRQAELFRTIHQRSRARVALHSCGAVRPLIGDFIEIGVEILNPVQVSAVGMEPAELKAEFGREIAFWGGGVDTQRVLWAGTPQEVRDEVRRRIDALAPGGGYVFAAVHNIQAGVPAENIVAMREASLDHGGH